MPDYTLYCHSGNDQVLSIDPNSLAIITLLHWLEVSFEIVTCCTKNESPSEELPALVIDETVYSGYRAISKGLKEVGIVKSETSSNISTLANREFLLKLNQDLLTEEFNNEEIFKNFTEPALLTAKSRYFWNFIKSRIFPLNYQLDSERTSNLINITKKSQRIDECIKITTSDPSIENKFLLFSHLIIRSLLPKQHQFPELSDFINEVSKELDRKEFKGKIMKNPSNNDGFKPVYKHENTKEYQENSTCLYSGGYTGLFGVIFAIAVFYSIKNR